MPRLPWTAVAAVDPGAQYLVVATWAALRHRRDLPRFLASTQTLRAGLQEADGLVGYELRAALIPGTLATVSAWRDRDALLAFTSGPGRQRAIGETRDLITETRVRNWTTTGRELPELSAP